ncbi:hypothetical protein ACTXT7_011345 [Hymenolepis weldensis]
MDVTIYTATSVSSKSGKNLTEMIDPRRLGKRKELPRKVPFDSLTSIPTTSAIFIAINSMFQLLSYQTVSFYVPGSLASINQLRKPGPLANAHLQQPSQLPLKLKLSPALICLQHL